MKTDFVELQKEIASNEEGRFIPYIGKEYAAGLNIGKGMKKILVIGPRHYCDASYSSRNLLAYMTEEQRKKLRGDPNATFPEDLKVGCVEESPAECLKKKHDKCPVYVAAGDCPLMKKCKIRSFAMENDGFNCNNKRNLRCETLYAVHEYYNEYYKKKPSIEFLRLGLIYFDLITKFLIDEFLSYSQKPSIEDIWDRIAFTNLVQRYIPLKDRNFDSKKIGQKIEDCDILFCKKEIIDFLKPDYIVMTMPCIEYALRTVLSTEYKQIKHYPNRGWYIFQQRNDSESSPFINKWEKLCARFFKEYTFPSSSKQLGAEIFNFIKVLSNDSITSGESLKSKVKNIRTVVLETVRNILKDSEEKPQYYKNMALKCLNPNLDLSQAEGLMRKWISNAHSDKDEKCYNWTTKKIKKWLNDNR